VESRGCKAQSFGPSHHVKNDHNARTWRHDILTNFPLSGSGILLSDLAEANHNEFVLPGYFRGIIPILETAMWLLN
jgi:hypothetical protein